MPKKECGAKTRAGGKCKQPAMANGRCRLHGGKSLKGIAHPNYEGKGYSKYMPVGLLDTYQEFVSDNDNLALNNQIALIDTYVAQLIEELGDYSSAELWEQLQGHVRDYHKASTDTEEKNLLRFIFDIIEAGASYVSKWDTLHKAMEQRRKLVADERKRRIENEHMIPVDRALLAASALMESVKQNVHDRDTLTAIQADFIRIAGVVHQQRLDDGDPD